MQEAATHEDLRDLHNGEPRRVSRSVAFFHRATDNTRYEEAGPFCGCRTEVLLRSSSMRLRAFSPQLHAASITATRSQIDYRVTRCEQIHFKKRPEMKKESCFGAAFFESISLYFTLGSMNAL